MSADNNILVAKVPVAGTNDHVWLVNMVGGYDRHDLFEGTIEEQDHQRQRYLNGAKEFKSQDEAFQEIERIENEYDRNGWWIEYGPDWVDLDRPLKAP